MATGIPTARWGARAARGWRALLLLAAAALAWTVLAQTPADKGAPPPGAVLVLQLDGIIGPASADFIHRGLARAQRSGARLVVLQMDTPGGLDSSMRLIIKDILASPVPVATFVAPEGARAASAGTYILYASHIAAMAPATNLGAATPVALGGTPGGSPQRPAPKDGKDAKDAAKKAPDADSKPAAPASTGDTIADKAINDAAAYIRSLAQLRGRNADFAEAAVRSASSLSANDALKGGVIEVIATDVPALLTQLEGRKVELVNASTTLRLAGAPVESLLPDWRNRLLAVISNPTLAMVLMMIGIYGLFIEFTSPGFGVPGVAGAIALLLGLYSLQLLPVNWAGMALLLLGVALMVAEVLIPSFGVLGVGGIIAFVVGGLMLFDTDTPGYGVPLAWIVGLALVSAAVIVGVGSMAWRARRRPVVSGREELAQAVGTVEAIDAGELWVRLHGELWRARAAGSAPAVGERVRVQRIDGLTLEVTLLDARASEHPPTASPDRSAPAAADPTPR